MQATFDLISYRVLMPTMFLTTVKLNVMSILSLRRDGGWDSDSPLDCSMVYSSNTLKWKHAMLDWNKRSQNYLLQ